MFHAGNMARVNGGRLVKVASIEHGMAECVWFDSRGFVHVRDYETRHLTPVWHSPKSLWPETNEMPDLWWKRWTLKRRLGGERSSESLGAARS